MERQVEEESVKGGLRRKYALCRSKWSVGVNKIGWVEGESDHPHLLGIPPDLLEQQSNRLCKVELLTIFPWNTGAVTSLPFFKQLVRHHSRLDL